MQWIRINTKIPNWRRDREQEPAEFSVLNATPILNPFFPQLRDSCERGGVWVATIQTVNEYRETMSSGHKAVVILVILGTVTVVHVKPQGESKYSQHLFY